MSQSDGPAGPEPQRRPSLWDRALGKPVAPQKVAQPVGARPVGGERSEPTPSGAPSPHRSLGDRLLGKPVGPKPAGQPGGQEPGGTSKGRTRPPRGPGGPPPNSRMSRAMSLEIGVKKVKPIHLMKFCRFMSVFLVAGIPILEALDIVRADTRNRTLRKMIVQVSADLRAGETFSTAISAHARRLPGYFSPMVRAAEETGQLAEVLSHAGDYIDRDIEARRKIKAAITYPIIVVMMSLVSVAILIGFVLPRFVKFFEEFHAQLPLPTRILVAVSKWVITWGPTVAITSGSLLVVLVLLNFTEFGKLGRDTVLLHTPLISGIVVYAVVERFCRVMAGMVQAGVPLPVAVDLAAKGAGNRRFAKRIGRARREMLGGGGLSGPLIATKLFPESAVQMLRVGEETGTLEAQLTEVSNFYGKELAYRLKRRTDMLEPAAVVIVGLLVGFVAVAIISAIYGVYQSTDLK
jgi:type IV pilus assembly protein PilC